MHSKEEKLGENYLTSKTADIPLGESPNVSGGKVAPENVKMVAKDEIMNEDPLYVERMTQLSCIID